MSIKGLNVSGFSRRKKISTTVYLRPDQVKKLKLKSERDGIPASRIIRAGIDLATKDISLKDD